VFTLHADSRIRCLDLFFTRRPEPNKHTADTRDEDPVAVGMWDRSIPVRNLVLLSHALQDSMQLEYVELHA